MHRRTPLPPGFAYGAFTTEQADAAGVSSKRRRSSDLEHPFWGICVAAGSVIGAMDRCQAFHQRMPAGAFFSHATAAILFGMPLPTNVENDERLHVTVVDPSRTLRTRGIIGHCADVRPRVVTVAGMPVLRPRRDVVPTRRRAGAG
ncbi:hypothetical protein JF66_14130 [Cryobacterium sp. MLB-32]|uniref:hypothetical protein n=1 Tax=Cryobacterium sp. MLB-32 TaxID=1529318 RepID=UPI0004E66ABE|nr:hypothetical protein [Cryobacterium sp. MLB-32]KFF59026.1 hypothetical protein JF66_14130 [Cryobacterium sp. MLB-32]